MAKSRREESPRPTAGARPLLDRHVAPEPGHVVGRAAGRGPGDLGPAQTHGDPDAVPIPSGSTPLEPRGLQGAPEGCRGAQCWAARRLRSSSAAWARGAVLPAHPGASRRLGLCGGRCPAGGRGFLLSGRGCGAGVPAFPGNSLALLRGLAPPPLGVGLVPAAACAHRASASVSPYPARSCQRFPLLLFLLLRPSPPLRTPSPPSTPRAAAAAPRALLLPPAHRSRLAGLLQSVSLSSFLSLQDQSKRRKTPVLLAISGKVAHADPNRDLCFPVYLWLPVHGSSPLPPLSDVPWKPKRFRSPPPPQHI